LRVARAIKRVKGVLKANASYRKKAAFVYTKLNMCNAKGAKAILDGLQKSKKYKGKIFSAKAIRGEGKATPVKLSPWPPRRRAVPADRRPDSAARQAPSKPAPSKRAQHKRAPVLLRPVRPHLRLPRRKMVATRLQVLPPPRPRATSRPASPRRPTPPRRAAPPLRRRAQPPTPTRR